jgi:AbrB family looped-hinge helix DNA binding protein
MSPRDPVLEYLTTARIGKKGQITVPRQFRKSLDLRKGARITLLRLGQGLILIPEQKRFESRYRRVIAVLAEARIRPRDLLATLPMARQRIFARRYGAAVASSRRRSLLSRERQR